MWLEEVNCRLQVIVLLFRPNVNISKGLRRNPIDNRAISSFSAQESGTRIILSILQSFLHFLKA